MCPIFLIKPKEKGLSHFNRILSAPLLACWDITYRCNLSCRHCCFDVLSATKANELTFLEGVDFINQLSSAKVISMQFAGGEPLVREDFLRLAAHASACGLRTNLATNGVLVDHSLAKELKKIGMCMVQVSLDGHSAQAHDYLRGTGMFQKTLTGIENLLSAGIRVSIASVLYKRNHSDFNKILELAASLGVKDVRCQFLLPQANGKKNLPDLYIEKSEIEILLKDIVSHPLVLEKKVSLAMPCFMTFLNKRARKKLFAGCGAGTVQVNLNPYGDVTACGILTDPRWSCGNIRKTRFLEVWQNNQAFSAWREPQQIKGKCAGCDIYEECLGGCRANAFLTSGDISAEDPLCMYEK